MNAAWIHLISVELNVAKPGELTGNGYPFREYCMPGIHEERPSDLRRNVQESSC